MNLNAEIETNVLDAEFHSVFCYSKTVGRSAILSPVSLFEFRAFICVHH